MSLRYLNYLVLILFFGCVNTTKKEDSFSTSTVQNAVLDYLKNKPGLQLQKSNDKLVVFTDGKNIIYSFKKEEAFFGDLNGDAQPDAIGTFQKVDERNFLSIFHIVFLNKNGKLEPWKEFDINMKIKNINKGIITAEKSILSTDSPNFGCNICKETIHLTLGPDSLKRIP